MTEGTDMNQIEKALSDYLGDMCGMRLKPHALTGLAKAAIAAMPVQAEPVAWMYVRRDDDAWPPSPPRVSLTRWGATGDYWDEIPIPAFPTPPAGGSDAE